MPLAFQSKLLRALQEREIRPVGATDSVCIDVRVISATNKNLEDAIACNAFREDLFFRLNVVTLDLPSLAERNHSKSFYKVLDVNVTGTPPNEVWMDIGHAAAGIDGTQSLTITVDNPEAGDYTRHTR